MRKIALLVTLLASLTQAFAADGRAQDVARLRTELAAAYYARGQYSVALEELKIAMEADSGYALAHNIEGLVYMDLREYATAERSFKHALDLDSSNADINHNFGWFLCNRLGRSGESLSYFRAAIRNPLYNTPEKSWQQLGLCAISSGDWAQAEESLQRADRLQPNQSATVLGLAQVAYRKGSFGLARDLLARQARMSSPTADTLWLNLRVERRLGNTESEAGFARELRTRFIDSPEARRLSDGMYD